MTLLRLHGYPVSNYFNVARAALIEKGLPHEIVIARAAQDEAFLARNPMGKIPMLETGEGWIGETVAICEYLDDRFPESSLRPADSFARARARQIVNVVQMYVEVPTRSLFPGVFGGGENGAGAVAAARATLDRATGALRRLMDPQPFLFGETPMLADLFAFYNLDIAERVGRFVFDRSIIAEIGIEQWDATLRRRASTEQVLGEFETYFVPYLRDRGAAYRPAQPALVQG